MNVNFSSIRLYSLFSVIIGISATYKEYASDLLTSILNFSNVFLLPHKWVQWAYELSFFPSTDRSLNSGELWILSLDFSE